MAAMNASLTQPHWRKGVFVGEFAGTLPLLPVVHGRLVGAIAPSLGAPAAGREARYAETVACRLLGLCYVHTR